MNNNYQAIIDWLMEYPELKSFLYFNTSQEELYNTSINTITSDNWETKYIRGGVKYYDFAIAYMGQYDKGTSDINVLEMFDTEKFMQWIEEQDQNKNYPKLNGEVISVENLQNGPTFSGVGEDGTISKYMFQIRIKYLV